jgi:hypothetical protein
MIILHYVFFAVLFAVAGQVPLSGNTIGGLPVSPVAILICYGCLCLGYAVNFSKVFAARRYGRHAIGQWLLLSGSSVALLVGRALVAGGAVPSWQAALRGVSLVTVGVAAGWCLTRCLQVSERREVDSSRPDDALKSNFSTIEAMFVHTILFVLFFFVLGFVPFGFESGLTFALMVFPVLLCIAYAASFCKCFARASLTRHAIGQWLILQGTSVLALWLLRNRDGQLPSPGVGRIAVAITVAVVLGWVAAKRKRALSQRSTDMAPSVPMQRTPAHITTECCQQHGQPVTPTVSVPEWQVWTHCCVSALGVFLYTWLVAREEDLFSSTIAPVAILTPLFYLAGHVWIFRRSRFTLHSFNHLAVFGVCVFVAPAFAPPMEGMAPLLIVVVGLRVAGMVLLGMAALAAFGGRRGRGK